VSAESGYPTGWVKSDDVVALQKASDYFSERIRLDSGSAQAHALRGSVRVYLGEFTDAIYDLIQARQIDPDLPLVYMGLGLVSLKRSYYEGAIVKCCG
jgi:lipoprotein NlpI